MLCCGGYNKLFGLVIVFIIFGCVVTGCSGNSEARFSSQYDENELINENVTNNELTGSIYVYVTGCVHNPGVYEVEDGTRIFKVIELAGGVTDEAYVGSVNMALAVSDGECIHVMSEQESRQAVESLDSSTEVDDGKININTASEEQLMTLPGVGKSKASAIVTYRTEYGQFSSIEEIMQVPGIKEACFSNIKGLIKV